MRLFRERMPSSARERVIPTSNRPDASLTEKIARADDLRDRGAAAAAAACYAEALAIAPQRLELRVQLGNMLKDSGQLVAAEAVYREAIAQDPSQPDTHVQLGHVLKLMGQRPSALEEYRRALALDPDTPGAVQELAEAGDRLQQERRFDTHFRSGGIEALLALSSTVAGMRDQLDRLLDLLPDIRAQTAFPVGHYDTFRAIFGIPVAPFAKPSNFHLLLLADRETLSTLWEQIAAIQAQTCSNWTLTVIGRDHSRNSAINLQATSDPRIRWHNMPPAQAEAEAERLAALGTPCDWLVLLAPGAVLHPQTLAWVAVAACDSPAHLFFFDEEAARRQGGLLVHWNPLLRQALDRDTLLQANIYGQTLVVRPVIYAAVFPELIDETVAWCRSTLLLEASVHGSTGHVPFPLVSNTGDAPTSQPDHRRAVEAHLAHIGLAGHVAVEGLEGEPHLTVTWRPRYPAQPIAVIIGTRDGAADARRFVQSLRETAEHPEALKIIVIDNGSSQAADLRLFDEMSTSGVEIVRMDEPFNWSRLNTQAARRTDAPTLVFANDDMQMITQSWDTQLRGLLERNEVGAVGARLLYEDGTLQHAGVLFGWKGSVIHDGLYEPATDLGPTMRWHLVRSVGAVTGAFLATSRKTFEEFGGFDASLPVAYSDIDYALRLRQAGLRVIWTPHVTLYHHESKSRGLDHASPTKSARNEAEHRVMQARWGEALKSDPSVHPFWCDATLPFRLMAEPSIVRIQRHITLCGAPDPWMPLGSVHIRNPG